MFIGRFDARRRLWRVRFVGVPVRADFRIRISSLPSWTRTAAPATGAATFVHVVERELVVGDCVRLYMRRTCQ